MLTQLLCHHYETTVIKIYYDIIFHPCDINMTSLWHNCDVRSVQGLRMRVTKTLSGQQKERAQVWVQLPLFRPGQGGVWHGRSHLQQWVHPQKAGVQEPQRHSGPQTREVQQRCVLWEQNGAFPPMTQWSNYSKDLKAESLMVVGQSQIHAKYSCQFLFFLFED